MSALRPGRFIPINAPARAFRGYGIPQVTWASESQLDRIAHQLGVYPVALRQRHLLARGEAYAPGDLPMDADLQEGLRRTVAALDWPQPSAPRRGMGLSAASKTAA